MTLLFNTYDAKGRGVLSFDLFVQACISLKRMTDVFKKYDTDRDGYITLSLYVTLLQVLSALEHECTPPLLDKRPCRAVLADVRKLQRGISHRFARPLPLQ